MCQARINIYILFLFFTNLLAELKKKKKKKGVKK